MSIWQRIKSLFAQPDPFEADDTYPHISTGPIPEDMRTPGMDTWKREMQADTGAYFRRVLGKHYNNTDAQKRERAKYRPSHWDRLDKAKNEQATQDDRSKDY